VRPSRALSFVERATARTNIPNDGDLLKDTSAGYAISKFARRQLNELLGLAQGGIV